MGDLEKPPHTPNLTFYTHLRNPFVSFVQKQSFLSSFSWYLDRTFTAHFAVVRGFSLGPKKEECQVNVLVMGDLEKPPHTSNLTFYTHLRNPFVSFVQNKAYFRGSLGICHAHFTHISRWLGGSP